MKIINFFLYCFFILFIYACESSIEKNNPSSLNDIKVFSSAIPQSDIVDQIPELAFYKHRLEEALSQDPPVLKLNSNTLIDESAIKAQAIALQDTQFIRDVYHRNTGEALRNEIMNVRKLMPADIADQNKSCIEGNCYRIELYNYFYNSTSIALVDVTTDKVLNVSHHRASQATINPHLKKIAVAIALNSPEVTMALGINPTAKDALMTNVTTALNGSKCERSRHLCVAPTFVVGDKALWTIVDLTDWRLVGLRWTDVGQTNSTKLLTERSIQDEFIMKNFCDKENQMTHGDWQITHRLTSSDGLEVVNVKYKSQKYIESAKIVDWHVSYSFKEGFGYNDAMGCPMFSTAAVVAFNAPYIEAIIKNGDSIGFALIQDFRSPVWPEPCNYRYQNRFEFFNDGSFRIAGAQLGRGCGITGMYRPVFRIHLGSPEKKFTSFEQWTHEKWVRWDVENWYLQSDSTSYNDQGQLFKITGTNGHGFYLEPNRGQFDDGSKGDHAYTYIAQAKLNEGENNLVSFGSCCATDFQQGPELFINTNESIINQDLVIWYVPQMANNNTPGNEYCWAETKIQQGKAMVKVWPGIVGPKFVPFIN